MNKIFKSAICAISVLTAGCLLFASACGGNGDTGNDKDKDKDKEQVTIAYTASALPEGEATVAYSASVATATGADNIRYTMNKGALPAGVTLSADGELSGKPTKEGDFNFTVRAASGTASATADFTLKINKHYYEITYAGAMLSAAVVGEEYEASVATATSTGTEPITYSAEGLPAGLTLAANGSISGTPTEQTDGAKTFKVTASADDAHPVTADFSITVAEEKLDPITYADGELTDAQIGVEYTASVATATGAESIEYTLYQGSALPAGLTLAKDGTISGTPTGDSDNYEVTVLASAKGYASATARFSLFVKPAKTLTKYAFEAEGVDLSDFSGSGISGHASGTDVIMTANANSGCSGGYYVGWTHAAGLSLTFVINADEAGTAKLSLSLGTESGVIPVKSSSMTVSVNGSNVNYDAKKNTIEFNQRYVRFEEYVVSESVSLKEGENIIVLTIADNKLGNGSAALGFMIDALYLETESYVSWTPHNTEITNK